LVGITANPTAPKLTSREVECLHWIAYGKSTAEIALILGLSVHTVRSYLKAVRLKLEAATIAGAVHKAVRLGIIGA
jgi:LuxR family transcriptional regulator, quorum-sensing system regulator CinR